MVQTAIQLHTLADIPETLPETIERVGATPLDGVEFFDANGPPSDDIADALDDSSLEAIGVHIPISRIEHEYEDVIESYGEIGCHRLIVPIYDADVFKSTDGIEAGAQRLSELASQLAADGFELLYHNHAFEFNPLEDQTAYDSFVDATESVSFELDTGLAAYGGASPTDLLSRHGDSIPLVHLTDSVPGNETTEQVELGAGQLEIEHCVEIARETDVEWLVYEHGQTDDTLGSLAHAATKLPLLSHGRDAFTNTKPVSTIIDEANSIAK